MYWQLPTQMFIDTVIDTSYSKNYSVNFGLFVRRSDDTKHLIETKVC